MFRSDGGLLPHHQCPMADVLRTGVSVHRQEVHIERPNGSQGIALVDIEPVRDTDRNIVGAVNWRRGCGLTARPYCWNGKPPKRLPSPYMSWRPTRPSMRHCRCPRERIESSGHARSTAKLCFVGPKQAVHPPLPTRHGHGTRVMENMIRQINGDMRFDWCSEGITCEIAIPT
jgi:hypothetical protein